MPNISQLDLAVRSISAVIRPAGVATTIVAIDGLGASGKSTLAALLAQRLSGQLIHTDDFARELEWWPRLRAEALVPLAAGTPAGFQRYVEHGDDEWQIVLPEGVVVLEGTSASRREFWPYLSFTIWVETAREARLARGLERAKRLERASGLSQDGAAAAEQWTEWLRKEDEWAEAEHPQDHVDLILSGEAPW